MSFSGATLYVLSPELEQTLYPKHVVLYFLGQGWSIRLVITDYQMPKLNGLGLLGAIKGVISEFPVIALSTDKNLEGDFLAVSAFVFLKNHSNSPRRTAGLHAH
ncbi:MAG: CheY-like chemotaxis protein [Gammaproteobacteria bacterium]